MNTIYDGTYVIGETSATNFVAGPGIRIDSPSAGTVRIGNDETVLFSASDGTSAATLSEPYTNFDTIKLYHSTQCTEFDTSRINIGGEFRFWHMYGNNSQATFKCAAVQCWATDTTHFNIDHTKTLAYNFTATGGTANSVTNNDQYARNIITKVIGINRISGNA